MRPSQTSVSAQRAHMAQTWIRLAIGEGGTAPERSTQLSSGWADHVEGIQDAVSRRLRLLPGGRYGWTIARRLPSGSLNQALLLLPMTAMPLASVVIGPWS
jgi:hypothetical protein